MVHRNGPPGASLGNTGTTSTGPGQRLASRDRRQALKRAQRLITKARAAKLCYLSKGDRVTITVGPLLVAHVSGVHRCGSLWSCPLCAPVVRQRRAEEIDQAASVVLAAGGCGLFVSGTGPHRKGDPLGPLFDLTAKWGELTMRGAKAAELRDRFGYIGSIRALEVTYGQPPFDNGWHPHVHTLMLFDRNLSPAEVAELRAFLFGRWQLALHGKGFGDLHPVKGVDVRPVYDSEGLSEYLTAVEGGWGVGLELARSDVKHKGVTPFELLGRWALAGDLEARALWLEYEAVTFGRRCIQWTPGLRRRLLPDVEELTDEEVAAAESEDLVCVTVVVDGWEWDEWVEAGRVGEVLAEIEATAALFMLMAGWLTAGPRTDAMEVRV